MNKDIELFIKDNNKIPYYDVDNIKYMIKYSENMLKKSNMCHLGQRKLLLTEIEFYNKFINFNDENNIVIYAGSAFGEHESLMIKLFPKIKFILIDPNYHAFNYKYKYLYQNINVIPKTSIEMFDNNLNNIYNDRIKHLEKISKKIKEIKFLLDKNNKYNALNINDNEYIKKMNNIKNKFYNKKNIMDKIIKSKTKFFIIQDYLNFELSDYLNKLINNSKYKINLYFVSDIRSVLNKEPSDIDILWNNALQIIFLKLLKPKYSMLKYRQYFYNKNDEETVN